MTANEDAATAVLATMGVPEEDMANALTATESVVRVFNPEGGVALTAQWECAAEFVATFAIVAGLTGSGLLQAQSLARAAYKLQRF